jgi:hypothetical protein
MVGVGEQGKLRPTAQVGAVGCFPSTFRTEPGGAAGAMGQALRHRSRVHEFASPLTRSRLDSLSVALWRDSAVVPLALQDQPGAVAVGRVTSLWKLYPYNRRTFRNAMETSGVRIQRKRLNAHWGIDIHRPNALARIEPLAGVVAIWAAKTSARIMP